MYIPIWMGTTNFSVISIYLYHPLTPNVLHRLIFANVSLHWISKACC